MGMFNFLKRNKAPTELTIGGELKSLLLAAEMEQARKQAANLRAVGRESDAIKVVAKASKKIENYYIETFLQWEDSCLPIPNELQIAQICYHIAYETLPYYAFKKFEEFLGFWSTEVPPISMRLSEHGCSQLKLRLTPKFAFGIQAQSGQLSSTCDYYLLAFPTPPPVHPLLNGGPENIFAATALPSEKRPVLAPYFATILNNPASGKRGYYLLGQSPGGGTTFRSIDANGGKFNLGPGPEPNIEAFLKRL